MATAQDAAEARIREFAGQTITYSTRGGNDITLTAVVGNENTEQFEGENTGYVDRRITFTVAQADLQVQGADHSPLNGEQIRWTNNGVERTFRVVAEAGERAFEYLSGQFTHMRISAQLEEAS
ncbi:MAG: hypothetical protein AAFQ71_11445 [Planctomycetota bacterium]